LVYFLIVNKIEKKIRVGTLQDVINNLQQPGIALETRNPGGNTVIIAAVKLDDEIRRDGKRKIFYN